MILSNCLLESLQTRVTVREHDKALLSLEEKLREEWTISLSITINANNNGMGG